MRTTWPARRRTYAPPARPRSLFRKLLDLAIAVVLIGLLAVLAARLDRVNSRTLAGTPVVNDGDTITLGVERIRLRGIDAPEYDQTCRKAGGDYACGRRARDQLKALVAGKRVTCEGWERDRYGRLLAVCSADGRDLNGALVEAGWAVSYGGYEAEEDAARRQGAGLWAGSFERPRDWRDTHGGMAEGEHDGLSRIVNWLRQLVGLG